LPAIKKENRPYDDDDDDDDVVSTKDFKIINYEVEVRCVTCEWRTVMGSVCYAVLL